MFIVPISFLALNNNYLCHFKVVTENNFIIERREVSKLVHTLSVLLASILISWSYIASRGSG